MKTKFLMGLLLVAVASIAVGSANFHLNAEISHPDPNSIAIYK